MTVSSFQTLLVFIGIFGVIGVVRGPNREIWTVCGMGLTALLLLFGGVPIFEQFPLRVVSGLLAMAGNQSGSNDMAAHPLVAPWTSICLYLAVGGLVSLAYLLGAKRGTPRDKDAGLGDYVAGGIMGAINGLIIAAFIFQNGFGSGVNIQFPDGLLTRTSVVPVILVAVICAIFALSTSARKPEKTAK